jgi:hypothetical protein
MAEHFRYGIAMLTSPQALNLIANNEELFNRVMGRKQELMLIIHGMLMQLLQDNSAENSLFTDVNPYSTGNPALIHLTYELVKTAGEEGCETCPITLDDIIPGQAVKISHTLEDGRIFSICLSKAIFEDDAIKKAMDSGKVFMKHPYLREKAYIDLTKVLTTIPNNPDQTGGAKQMKPKRTDKKITIKGRERTVYVGKHNKQYVQINRQFVAVSSLTTHKKTRK